MPTQTLVMPNLLQQLSSLCPNAVSAGEWEEQGNSFDRAQLHLSVFSNPRDDESIIYYNALAKTLQQYGAQVQAMHVMQTEFGTVSVELLFEESVGSTALMFCNTELNP